MTEKYKETLHSKVNQFKFWAKTNYPMVTEDNDNGEWCLDEKTFNDMCTYSLTVIDHVAASEATEQMIDDLLYAIARDNECSMILYKLEEHSEWFALLCRHCLNTEYTNAKWQFAEHLPNYQGSDDLKEMVYDFLQAGDEYTERLALRSLAAIHPEHAERYAVEFWERNKYEYDEYQKIMVLHVLYQIRSAKLPHYLALAEKSEYEYLRWNAAEIQDKQHNDI